jgi:hypothetical protein
LQSKIILNCLAISDDDERLEVAFFDSGDATRTQLRTSGGDGQIEAKRLDSVDLSVGRIDLILVTVNGLEEQVLAGARQTLAQIRPTYVLVGSLKNPKDITEVEQILTESGYARDVEFGGGEILYHRVDKQG